MHNNKTGMTQMCIYKDTLIFFFLIQTVIALDASGFLENRSPSLDKTF